MTLIWGCSFVSNLLGSILVGFGGKWGLVIRGRSLSARAGVESHGTVILGKLEAWKGVVDGYKVFSLENSGYRNFILEEKKPE